MAYYIFFLWVVVLKVQFLKTGIQNCKCFTYIFQVCNSKRWVLKGKGYLTFHLNNQKRNWLYFSYFTLILGDRSIVWGLVRVRCFVMTCSNLLLCSLIYVPFFMATNVILCLMKSSEPNVLCKIKCGTFSKEQMYSFTSKPVFLCVLFNCYWITYNFTNSTPF